MLSMNCLGLPVPLPGLRRRLSALGKAIIESEADIACLQEVWRWRHVPLLRYDEEAWSHAVAVPHPYAPKGGLVTLSRLPVVDMEYHVFQERGSVASLHATERHQAKGVLKTVLRFNNQDIVVLNTHLAANYTASWSSTNPYAKVERRQLREIAEIVHDIPADTLVVVSGDFNVPRGSWLYHEFRAATGLHDPLGNSDVPTFRPPPGLPARAIQALDHIMVRVPQGLAVALQSQLCFGDPVLLPHGTTGYLSDHLGVRLTLEWGQPAVADQLRHSPGHTADVSDAASPDVSPADEALSGSRMIKVLPTSS
jgi:endonuclease/exonuclease/phosphatase family metal-dependent hydrolase